MFAIECFGITDGPFENFDTAFRTLFERIGYVVLADTVMGFAVNDRCFMSLTHGSETFETGFDELEAMAKALGVIKDDRLRRRVQKQAGADQSSRRANVPAQNAGIQNQHLTR